MEEKKETVKVSAFSKEQIINSKRYSERRDLLIALLRNDKQYTHAEIQALMEKFMKGKVN